MSVAAWRIRKRVKAQYDIKVRDEDPIAYMLDWVLNIIDEELEAEAERQFTQPLNPDPTTGMARELKEAK